jgi:hypothetical protein
VADCRRTGISPTWRVYTLQYAPKRQHSHPAGHVCLDPPVDEHRFIMESILPPNLWTVGIRPTSLMAACYRGQWSYRTCWRRKSQSPSDETRHVRTSGATRGNHGGSSLRLLMYRTRWKVEVDRRILLNQAVKLTSALCIRPSCPQPISSLACTLFCRPQGIGRRGTTT